MLPSRGSSATIPVSGLAWRKLRTWRRSGRCISVLRWRYQYVHDEARVGEKITKLGGDDAKTPFTERPATYASKSPGPNASKMVRRLSART